ncbi:MAG: hypothetical protein M5U26_13905 [Planctomycetota bacterium]|nr:hypothetical protein [Planctomycetota bacterium]
MAAFKLGVLAALDEQANFAKLAQEFPGVEPVALAEPAAGLDAVVIATPLERRATDALACLRHGAHALVAMPFSLAYAEFDALIGEANARDLRLGAWLPLRYAPANRLARGRLLAHTLGAPKSAHLDAVLGPGPGGFLGSLAPLLNLACWILGEAPVKLSVAPDDAAEAARPAASLHGWLALGHGGNSLSFATSARSTPDLRGGWALTVHADGGALRLGGDGSVRIARAGEDWMQVGSASPKPPEAENLLDFLDACQSGREPSTNALDAMQAIALTLGAVESARTRRCANLVRYHYDQDKDMAYARELAKARKPEKEGAA